MSWRDVVSIRLTKNITFSFYGMLLGGVSANAFKDGLCEFDEVVVASCGLRDIKG